MIAPLKLNISFWPKFLINIFPSSKDPTKLINSELTTDEFTQIVSIFKFGATYKLTKKNRYPKVINEIKKLKFSSPPIVLDVGASDGIASLQLIENIKFEKYYLTDLNNYVIFRRHKNKYYLYDSKENCILIVTRLFIVYPALRNSIFPFNRIADYIFKEPDNTNIEINKIGLINPRIINLKDNIVIEEYNIFEEWQHNKIDLLIAANILNRSYFSEEKILRAIKNIISAIRHDGLFVIIENRAIEKASIFKVYNDKIEVIKKVNGGSELEDLILHYWSQQIDLK